MHYQAFNTQSFKCSLKIILFAFVLLLQLEAAPHEPPEKLVAFQQETTPARPGRRIAAQFPAPSHTSTPMTKPHVETAQPRPTAPRVCIYCILILIFLLEDVKNQLQHWHFMFQ